jgi:hypothetical protein
MSQPQQPGLGLALATLFAALLAFLLATLLPNLAHAEPANAAPAPLSGSIGQWLHIPLTQPDPSLCPSSGTAPALSLRLNGLDTGLQAVGCDATAEKPSVIFRLSPDTAGNNATIDAAWQAILHNPWHTDQGHFVRSFELKLLKADGTLVQKSQTLLLTLVTPARLYAAFGLIAAVWLILFQAGRRSTMLRDSNSSASGLARPYSLARVQMAWWFALIFAAYVLLWTLTRDWVALAPSTLILLGISGATSLAAGGIDQSPSGTAGTPRTVPASAGFFADILTDVNGITLARLQMLLWNVTLGLVFVGRIFADLRIPDLDASTLGLLGLSAGAYVGFKVPEKQTADATDSPASVIASPAAQPVDNSDPKAAYGTE